MSLPSLLMNALMRDIARARESLSTRRYQEHTSSTGDLAIRENASSPRERPDRAPRVEIHDRHVGVGAQREMALAWQSQHAGGIDTGLHREVSQRPSTHPHEHQAVADQEGSWDRASVFSQALYNQPPI